MRNGTDPNHSGHGNAPVRIGLVDDHAVVRDGYKRYIALETGLTVVLEAADAETAYARLGDTPVDVLVMDLSMPGRGGLEGVRRILARYPSQVILVFTMHEQADRALQCLRAGARGYITKSQPPDALIAAIRRVASGQIAVSPDVHRLLEQRDGEAPHPPHLSLTPREFDIFLLLADGRSVEEIGQRLQLGAKTVANYQTLIRQKLAIHNAVDLYRYAVKHGLL